MLGEKEPGEIRQYFGQDVLRDSIVASGLGEQRSRPSGVERLAGDTAYGSGVAPVFTIS